MSEHQKGSQTAWRGDAGVGVGRTLLTLLGGALLIAGIVVMSDHYNDDYDCIYQMKCHNDGGRHPVWLDRATAAAGFGLEQDGATGDPLPGPEGSILVVGGLVLLLGALLVPPSQRAVEATEIVVARPPREPRESRTREPAPPVREAAPVSEPVAEPARSLHT